jgi:hypothetical protein
MTEYQPAILSTADGKSYALGVRPRGKFRRRIAEIPPLKLKIKKKVLAAEGLVDSLNELKLVLPITLDETGNELVIREYLVYRMYEQVSPYCVRARLINLTLLNTDAKKGNSRTVKAILLEDAEETAARLGGTMLDDTFGMTTDSLHTGQAALTTMFQYMIGNTDWNIAEYRNLRFLRKSDGVLIPIPFDFDFCGFVDAPYATPIAGVGLRSVQDRHLMAGTLAPEALQEAAQLLYQQRHAFRDLCRSGLLPAKSSQFAEEYLEEYFKEVRQKETGE